MGLDSNQGRKDSMMRAGRQVRTTNFEGKDCMPLRLPSLSASTRSRTNDGLFPHEKRPLDPVVLALLLWPSLSPALEDERLRTRHRQPFGEILG